jgi:poly(A) polymerase
MVALEEALSLHADPVRRLAALAVLVAEDAERLWQKLRLTNAEHARLIGIAERWWRISPAIGENAARALIYRLGPELFTDHVALGWARSGALSNDQAWRQLATTPQRWTAPEFPLAAADFIKRGVEKGPGLGAALAAAERAWITAGFPMDAKALERITEAAMKSEKS